LNRLNEVSFNAAPRELRIIALLRQVLDPGSGESEKWAHMRFHRISSDMMVELNATSTLLAEWEFLRMLCDKGRRAAQEFLERRAEDIGVKSSLDLDLLFDRV
jgi:NTE family protein